MEKTVSYKSTITASYLANIIQACIVNLTPILFIPIKEQFGLSYAQFGLLVFINFVTQVAFDLIFAKAVDKFGFRIFIVGAHLLAFFGLVLFALTPFIFSNVFIGFVIATVMFSGGGGLFELLLSPIIDAIPSEAKDKAMALLHSFYAWGQVGVVIITTLLIFAKVNWIYIVMMWAVFPLLNAILFSRAPLAKKHQDSEPMKIRELIKKPIFILAFIAIAFGGAAEVTMAQWASTFMEKSLGLPKIAGDILGLCGFAFMLGIGRTIYGILGERLNMQNCLIFGSLGAVVCYFIVALSPFTWLSILACCVCGLCVSLLWPGVLVIASSRLPLAGASMFALLASSGDIGASIGPYLTGLVTDFSMDLGQSESLALKIGLLSAVVFPLVAMITHTVIKLICKKYDRCLYKVAK